MLIRCAGELPFTLDLDHLPQDNAVERDVFSFWCVLSESICQTSLPRPWRAFRGSP